MEALRWRDEQRRLRAALGQREAPAESASAATSPFVSIIVVCWNSEDVLGRCLEQLFAQDYRNREIVVVDDGSDDRTFEVAERLSGRAELTLVRSSQNRGCPAARNLGLRHAGGEIVAFIDADGFADSRWLTQVVRAFGDNETIGGVASTVFYDDNPMVLNGAGGTVNRQGWAADLSMNESFEYAELAEEALYPMGCGMALRREALERVGPFDETMLNYYDDVDYGVRLWRAGYRIRVAAAAWIDHAAAGGDSAFKQLLCERHRMRVVLKHAPLGELRGWSARELAELRAASTRVRLRKLKAMGWNARHLPSLMNVRRRLSGESRPPSALRADSWGDGFPAGVPQRRRPVPRHAGAVLAIEDPRSADQLLHGWFPTERVGERSYRWAAPHAAVLLSVDRPVRRLSLDYAHAPVDMGEVDVRVRRIAAPDLEAAEWRLRLPWQYIARSVENHPLRLPAGDYEVAFAAARGWSDPPRELRSLALALSRVELAESFDIELDGIEMGCSEVERQLVSGWYEAEPGAERPYRWATGEAAAVVRLSQPARAMHLAYRRPPVSIGLLRVAVVSLEGLEQPVFDAELSWRDAEWHEQVLPVDLPRGDYLVRLSSTGTWSNPESREPQLWPENRSLGFALSSLTFERG